MMTYRHVELREEGARDLARVGAGVLRRQVLRAEGERDLVGVEERLHGAQVGEGREDRDLDRAVLVLGVLERPVQLLDERDRLQVVEVHLPVACDERGAACQQLPSEDLQSGKLLAFEELEARAAARRDVAELVVGEAELAHGGGRVAAADDATGRRPWSAPARPPWCPPRTPRISNTPIGPFQNTVLRVADRRRRTAPPSRDRCPGPARMRRTRVSSIAEAGRRRARHPPRRMPRRPRPRGARARRRAPSPSRCSP